MFNRFKVLVFDFDGVIADSQKECLFLSYQTFTNSKIASFELNQIPSSFSKTFLKYRYLVGPPEEYLSLCESINSNRVPESFKYSQLSDKEIDFKERFFQNRRILIDERNKLWKTLVIPFQGIISTINKLSTEYEVSISSTRDSYSINQFSKNYNLAITSNEIWGNEAGQSKVDHMRIIKQKYNVEYKDISFIDDNINHLLPIEKLGVNCFLSEWGYSHPNSSLNNIETLSLEKFMETTI